MEAEAEAAKFFEKISGSRSGSGEKDLEAEAEAFFKKKFQMEAEIKAIFFKIWKRRQKQIFFLKKNLEAEAEANFF